MQRFDEIELQSVPLGGEPVAAPLSSFSDAHRLRRLLSLLVDISLFAALSLALVPMLPADSSTPAVLALAGFVLLASYYYFVGSWLLWGKTVGGAIFDVRIVAGSHSMSVKAASLRWAGVCFSLLTGGAGFALAALPSRRSLPDLISGTRSVAAY